MRAPISVIIPTLNAEETLGPTLGALGEGLEAGLIRELIVSDGGSDDGTRAVAEAAGALWVEAAAGRGGQLRRGAQAARGDWLLFLHADTWLGPGWAGAVLTHLSARADRAGYFRLAFRANGWPARWTAGWAQLRSRGFGLPYGDQALLVPRALYDAAGGYPDIPLMEDVALARALKGRLAGLDATALTGAERYARAGWLAQGSRNLIRLLRYLGGADPAKLARRYR